MNTQTTHSLVQTLGHTAVINAMDEAIDAGQGIEALQELQNSLELARNLDTGREHAEAYKNTKHKLRDAIQSTMGEFTV